MSLTLDVVKRITVQGKQEGLDKLAKGLKDVDQGLKQVGGSAGNTTKKTDEQAKSAISAAAAWDRMMRSLDPVYKAQRVLETETKKTDRALKQGAITNAEHARSLQLLQQRYQQVIADSSHLRNELTRTNFAAGQLTFQLNDVATGLATGQSPFMIAAQQAGQFSQILGANGGGLRGAASLLGQAFMSMLNPINGAIIALGAGASAAAYFFSTADDGSKAAEQALERHEALIEEIVKRYGEAAEAALGLNKAAAASELAYRAASNERETQRRFDKELNNARDDLRLRTDPDALMAFPEARPFQAAIDAFERGQTTVDQFRESVRNIAMSPTATDEMKDFADELRATTDLAAQLAARLREAQTAVGIIAATPRMREPYDPQRNPALFAFPLGPPLPVNRPSELTVDPYEVLDAPRPPEGGNPLYNLAAETEPKKERAVREKRDPFADAMSTAAARIQSLEQEKVALGLTGEALARYRAETQFLNSVRKEWTEFSPEQQRALEEEAKKIGTVAAELERAKKAQEELEEAQDRAAEAFENFGQSVEEIFLAFVEGGDAAKKAIAKLIAELLRAMLIGQGPFAGFFQKGGLLTPEASSGASAGSAVSAAASAVGGAANSNIPGGGAAALLGFLSPGKGASHVEGMNPQFSGALSTMFANAPESVRNATTIFSGFRSVEHQQRLWEAALKKYGDPEIADNWVARPGTSNHNLGMAADLRFATPEAREWFHANAGDYGMQFPMKHEPWHIEGAADTLKAFTGATTAATENLGGLGNVADTVGEALAGAVGGGGGGGVGGIIGSLIKIVTGGGGSSSTESVGAPPAARGVPRAMAAARYGGSQISTSIVVQGNADENTVAKVDQRLKAFSRDINRQMEQRDANKWRTA